MCDSLLSFSMQQNPSSAIIGSSFTQEPPPPRPPNLLWNPEIHYRVHETMLLAPMLSQTDLGQSVLAYVFKFHFYNVLTSSSRSSNLSHRFRFSTKTLYEFFTSEIILLLYVRIHYSLATEIKPRANYDLQLTWSLYWFAFFNFFIIF
jgi:hypothetical protein